MRILPLLCPLALLILLSGCVATAPPLSPQELSQIDYGPAPGNYEKIIKDHFAKTLFEPETAQYRFGKPFRGYQVSGPLLGGKVLEAGYVVEVWLKAKDRAGGFLPERHLGVLLKNGEVSIQLTESELSEVKRP